MNASEAAVFGIMDYWTFDGFLAIRDFLRRHPEVRLEKTVFPGMELRCEAPVDNPRLNIHVLLSDELTDQELRDFRAFLKLTPGKRPLSDEALENLHRALTPDKLIAVAADYEDRVRTPAGRRALGAQIALVQRDDIYSALRAIPGKGLLIVPWETYGGFTGIDWKRHPAVVTDFMNHADVYETRKGAFVDLFQGRRTESNDRFFENFSRSIGQPRGVVSGSDAHKVADYGRFPAEGREGERATWIKADPTFEGLRQMLCEPSDRVFIGAEPQPVARVHASPTKYMRSVEVRKRPGSALVERWFDAEVPLNPGLIAIIGNKGSGKSALADVIGLLGDSSRHPDFSFLCEAKFRDPKEKKADHFDGTLTWCDGIARSRSLAAKPDPLAAERVRYVPQQYLEKVCNEVDPGPGSAFDRELKAVIFSHVPEPDRLGTSTLDGLLALRRKVAEEALRALRDELRRINAEIVRVEDLLAPRQRQALQGRLDLRLAELEAHESARPAEVMKPDADPVTKAELEAASVVLNELRVKAREAAGRVDAALAAAKALSMRLAAAQRIGGQIDAFERDANGALERIAAELPDDADFAPADLVAVTLNRAPLDAYRSRTERVLEQAKAELDSSKKGTAAAAKAAAEAAVAEHLKRMQGPALRYEEFREATSRWEARR
ncbi:MAG: hypothetical protein L6R30_23670, partial [Thermoanaerobaculia bacterium]|nr:hypothetical protein [Thermoanaerobaculia bacterium]